jgi:prephenate dehydrogenase
VAAINAEMWAELFLANRDALLREMKGLIEAMENISRHIESGDRQGLAGALSAAAKAKEERL